MIPIYEKINMMHTFCNGMIDDILDIKALLCNGLLTVEKGNVSGTVNLYKGKWHRLISSEEYNSKEERNRIINEWYELHKNKNYRISVSIIPNI